MKKTIIKWSCAFLAAVILVGATAVVSFWAAKKSFEDEAFLVKSNKISFDEEEVDENLIAKFKEIKRRIGEEYYLEYDENDLVEGAIQGMVDGLNDPYTQYFTAQEMESWNSQLQGEYVGTGFIVSEQTEEYILIGSVKEETPAAYAELKAGDKIVSINEKNISEYTESEIWELFATEGVTLTLSMVRNEGRTCFTWHSSAPRVRPATSVRSVRTAARWPFTPTTSNTRSGPIFRVCWAADSKWCCRVSRIWCFASRKRRMHCVLFIKCL